MLSQVEVSPRKMIAASFFLVVATSATIAAALSCDIGSDEHLELEIVSVEVDGVPQEDLSAYQELTVEAFTFTDRSFDLFVHQSRDGQNVCTAELERLEETNE